MFAIWPKFAWYFLNMLFTDSFRQIERIADFIIPVMWLSFLKTKTNFTNNGNRLIYTGFNSSVILWFIQICHLKLSSSGSNIYLNIDFLFLSIALIPSLGKFFFLNSMFWRPKWLEIKNSLLTLMRRPYSSHRSPSLVETHFSWFILAPAKFLSRMSVYIIQNNIL